MEENLEEVNNYKDPEKDSIDLEQEGDIYRLLEEINKIRDQEKKLRAAMRQAKRDRLYEKLGACGAIYLEEKAEQDAAKDKLNDLKREYKEVLDDTYKTYIQKTKEIAIERQNAENKLEDATTKLTDKEQEFSDFRKNPTVAEFEKNDKAFNNKIEDYKKKIENEKEPEKKHHYIKEIKTIKEEQKNASNEFKSTPLGQEYTKRRKSISAYKGVVTRRERLVENIDIKQENLDKEMDAASEKMYNEFKENTALIRTTKKQSKFFHFLGAIKAKLGIGKAKQENNLKDTITNAIAVCKETKSKIKDRTKVGAKKIVGSLHNLILNKARAHYQAKCEKYQAKLANIEPEKTAPVNPDQAEPSR